MCTWVHVAAVFFYHNSSPWNATTSFSLDLIVLPLVIGNNPVRPTPSATIHMTPPPLWYSVRLPAWRHSTLTPPRRKCDQMPAIPTFSSSAPLMPPAPHKEQRARRRRPEPAIPMSGQSPNARVAQRSLSYRLRLVNQSINQLKFF